MWECVSAWGCLFIIGQKCESEDSKSDSETSACSENPFYAVCIVSTETWIKKYRLQNNKNPFFEESNKIDIEVLIYARVNFYEKELWAHQA
jgi:hypothetical protein